MMDTNVFLLGALLLTMLVGIVWAMSIVRLYSERMSRIYNELHTMTTMLNEMPKELSLQEYMFSHDRQLRSIGEKLDTHPDPALLQQYIQEHTQHLRTIISLLGEGSETALTRANIENSLQVTNDSLEKVLWSLRFDEDRYAESAAATASRFAEPGKAKLESINKDRETRDDTKSMKAILKDNDDSYDAMLEYMEKTGKGGSNALQALDSAGGLHSR